MTSSKVLIDLEIFVVAFEPLRQYVMVLHLESIKELEHNYFNNVKIFTFSTKSLRGQVTTKLFVPAIHFTFPTK